MDLPWLALGSFVSGLGSLYLLAQLRTHWDKPGARWFVATIVTQTVWCFSYGAALLVFDPALRLALEMASWLGIIWIGFCFLSFALGYTGRTNVLESSWYRGVAVLPIAGTVLVVTNPLHTVVWEGFRVVPAAGSAGADYAVLPMGLLTIIVAMLFVSFGTLLVFDTVVSYGPLYRSEALAVGLSPIPPGAGVLLWAGGIGPIPAVNLTTLLFLPHVALDLYAFVRSDMFEFHPATRRAGERAAIHDIATPVAIVDEQGRVVNLNPAAEGMLAVDKHEALTKPLNGFLAGDTIETDGGGSRASIEAGGRHREFKIRQTALRDEAGTQLGYTVVFQDITDEIRRERRLEVLNRFLRHNVRNESVVIQARAELLAGELDGDHAEYAATIEQSVSRLIDSGEKARTLAEAGADDAALDSIVLADLVTEVIETASDEYSGSVTVEIPHDLRLTTQPALLEVLLANLVENALQHVPDAVVTVGATVEGNDVVLTVSDNGPGIPEHELGVLDRGRETDLNHGSGIGLWLIRWTATTLEGDLAFDTSDGTTVTVRLPKERTAAEAA
ncbi:PAS domain-containing protein [Haloarcula sp. CBA1130]|uniref:histidine kinase N-terminal 7TM domain-containing protein n=1 Tax=unclassified Haloarcula TaxID=2624677 RepID=UPI001245DE89|nr:MULTISPECIES: histidine kinase N-terminal 7TM domain-containing protein [unclassified Haloarcula]KAA9399350.1 PAS domain-containing protein [Haloarcula sp. CBA1129]KAA9403864.1 PAS domain-containing protein [Haloarcula sp. CBA1130]